MHPHVITDGSTQQPVEVDESASDQGSAVLGGNDDHVGIRLFSGCTESAANVPGSVHRLQLDTKLAGPLLRFFEQCVDRVVAAASWSQVVVADMNAMQHAAGDAFGEFASQLEGVIADASSVDAHHQTIDVADIKVVSHQQHWPRRELEDVLARAVGQDRLESSQTTGAHHDEVGIELVSHLEHGLLGIALAQDRVDLTWVEAKLLNCFCQQGTALLPVLLQVAAVLVGDHMQEVEPGAGKAGDVPEHADHFFHMTLAGIGNQQVAEHQWLERVAAAYGDQLRRAW